MAVNSKTFTFTGYVGNLLDSRFFAGSVVIIVPEGLWSDPLEDVDYYVSTTGSDSNDGTTANTAFLTIKKAMQTIAGQTGKTIQVQNGTYQTTNNLINDDFHSVNISGTSGARNRIQAQSVGGAIITDAGISSLATTHNAIKITTSSYVDVTGFLIDFTGPTGNGNPPSICHIGGTNGYNRIARCIVRKTGNVDSFGSWFRLSGSYNLCEDCSGVGGSRYGFSCGGTESTDNHLVFRRCLARLDYSQSNQPKSPFNHYGANGGGTTNYVAYLNCIALNTKAGNWGGGSSGFTYGGISIIKTAANDYLAGNIILNEETEYGGIWLDGSSHTLYDNVIWDMTYNPFTEGGSSPAGLFVRSTLVSVADVKRFTIGDVPNLPIRNLAGSKFSSSNNLLNPTQSFLLHPNAGPYTADGATVINRIGTSGTFFGDSGWNTVTDVPLWPWINEDLIKTQFSRSIAIPSGGANGQTSINTTRGFCASGTQLDGATPITLTSYIWEFLGTQMPTSIYA